MPSQKVKITKVKGQAIPPTNWVYLLQQYNNSRGEKAAHVKDWKGGGTNPFPPGHGELKALPNPSFLSPPPFLHPTTLNSLYTFSPSLSLFPETFQNFPHLPLGNAQSYDFRGAVGRQTIELGRRGGRKKRRWDSLCPSTGRKWRRRNFDQE